ncbi:hypothetical protein ScPMuIL_013697 [Solemya velum]
MSAVGEADIKLNIDRNSNLSPSRLPRPLGSPGSHENHPFPTQTQKIGYRSEDNSKVTKSAVDQRDGSKERSVGTSKERSAGTSNSKDSRIPQRRLKSLKTPAETISKSSEDLSKMRKKSALKHSIKNFFGKKRKSAKIGKEFSSSIDLSTNTNFFDPGLRYAVVGGPAQLAGQRERNVGVANIDDGDGGLQHPLQCSLKIHIIK